MELKEKIYDMVLGEWAGPEGSTIKLESSGLTVDIENAFEDGGKCDKLYEAVFEANKKVCERLGVEECKELEIIINNLTEIQTIVASKMYDYGYQVAKNN